MEPNGQPPRIQVALATGKLVLPEQGCLGQGGCEAKPDYDKVWSRTVSPRVSKSCLRRVSSSCPSKGAWDKGVVRLNPIMTRCEDQPLNKAVDKEGRE